VSGQKLREQNRPKTRQIELPSRGVFNKALDFGSLQASFWPLLLAVPVILGLSIILLKKQET